MKLFLIATLLTVCGAVPQGYGGGRTHGSGSSSGSRGCRTVNTVEYDEIEDQKCTPYQDQECHQRTREKCVPYQDEVCKTVQRRQCQTKYKRECKQAYRTVNEPYTDTVCKDEWVTECEKTWQQTGYGEKEWLDDPSTCQKLKKTRCEEVTKSRPRREEYQDCNQVPYEDCRNVPDRQCQTVTKQRCSNVPYNDCQTVTKQRCVPFHKKVPRQVTKQVCPGDADWNQGSPDYDDNAEPQRSQGGYDAASVDAAFDIRNGGTNVQVQTKPAVKTDEEKYDDSRIVFQE